MAQGGAWVPYMQHLEFNMEREGRKHWGKEMAGQSQSERMLQEGPLSATLVLGIMALCHAG